MVGDVHVTGTFISGATTTYGDGTIDLSSGTNLNIDNGTFYVDNSNNRVGFGTTAPQAALDVTTSGFSALDQSSTDQTGSTSRNDSFQSFTAGLTGKLTRVDLRLHSGIPGQPQTATVEIYSGRGVGGQLLTSQSVVFQDISNVFQEVLFTWPPDVVAGQQYTIRFYVPSPQVLSGIALNQNNGYIGGSSNYGGWDYLFKTYVAAVSPTLMVDSGSVFIGALNGTGSEGTHLYFLGADGNATDDLWLGRFNAGSDSGQLRINIGDDGGSNDCLDVGYLNPTWISAHTLCADGTLSSSSDERLKTNIQTVQDALAKVTALRGVTFQRSPQISSDPSTHIGLIAQEVEQVLPEVVRTGSDGYKSVAYDEIIGVLVEAIKDQVQAMDDQQAEIEKLKDRLADLEQAAGGAPE